MVHAGKLEELAARARAHEEHQELAAARDDWQSVLALLPAESSQATWVRAKLDELTRIIGNAPARSAPPAWARKLGPLAPLAVLLLKGKFLISLLKLKFLLSFLTFAGIYWALYGAKFGIGIAVLVLVHELGHFVAVKRYGLRADLPVFIPGFGAYVRWAAAGVSASTRAIVSLAGPLAGLIGAAVCAFIWLETGEGLWIGLASVSAMLNFLNLTPIWSLDGGQAMVAIDRSGRIMIAVAAIVFAAFFSQPLLLVVGGGAVFRAFGKDVTDDMSSSFAVTTYFVVLLCVLGYLSTLAPLGARVQG
jgi:Zn-dependent protease